ncbi:MAG: bifunctional diaminohydroxyphosphoribosylaminopyrimidine deaminase/5-amino-6-(5-phosphoribosylamino)uracil reductase RibD [Alsobacter sp.]
MSRLPWPGGLDLAGPASDPRAVDERMMRHALALARRGLGNTWPNPAVGAVVWRIEGGRPIIVGRGWTQPGGRPHAETVALAQAGDLARGASMAVTLEPCSHFGKTAPCCNAIREAGVARVVSAIEDPDPRVNGRGHIILRAAGIEVAVGMLAREARASNLGFIRRVVDKRPGVTLKLAVTADGVAGRSDGARLLITGPEANRRVHMLRAQHDAVMVGIGTVLADDPQLTCRLPGLESRSPVRIVLDAALRTPVGSRLVQTAHAVPTWILAATDASEAAEEALAGFGVVVERVEAEDGPGRLSLVHALERLAARGLTRVLCEGGPTLGEALVRGDLVDNVIVLSSPDRYAGPAGAAVPGFGPALRHLVGMAETFQATPERRLGRDSLRLITRRF